MAKAIPSAALGSISGTAGGVTFSNGPFGLMFGSKSRPVNSASTAQLGIRGAFATLTKRWANVLTPAQQAGWIAYAAAHQTHDALGQLITLTGVQQYAKANGALKAALQATIDDAPATATAGNPGLITVTAKQIGPPTLKVGVTTNPAPTEVPIVWSLHPVSIGKKALTKSFIIIQVFPPGTNGPYDILANWNAHYGLLLTFSVIACQVQYTESTTGWQGTKSQNAGVCS